ncbi:YgiQ family radical SAM protein [Desulfonema ishimotonii]|uniref:YgiQ family radical SAM protein n=1 Tax=Desulfonema ishimotonii TaxID=45657 RepID=A0A401FXI7_9BACT|nr:YgiQ family radical SAM protein [Desulfonema ishimotonii]GBC61722.1 YgiQ family radical SAM protein [Desulfonema ishimotonii]
MFLPTTRKEIKSLGWNRPDVILVTGDTYIDSPHIGVAVIGKYLLKHGFRTAIIAQPSTDDAEDITRLGEPALFWGVTAGSVDSMVANYTPTLKRRRQDDYTPGGVNTRPNRATIAYTNLIRKHFKNTRPIVLGGIEASLRRIAHYDYWKNKVRRSVLFDAKADIIAYGMAEKTVLELARSLRDGTDWQSLRGICYIANTPGENHILLPSFETVSSDRQAFLDMTKLFNKSVENTSDGLSQKHGDRFLIQSPPHPPLSSAELDEIYDMRFERDAHPYYKTGEIRALETIRQSVTTHRGCFGQCSFCAIAVHQGRSVVSRSMESVTEEVVRIRDLPGFNGIIHDVGGPTANMYGTACRKGWACKTKHCLMPRPCPNLSFGHRKQMELLGNIRNLPGIRKVFVSSGIRHDMVVADTKSGKKYVRALADHHVSGQIKLAPEHSVDEVLALMNKPSVKPLMQFRAMFENACAESGKRYFMTYYIMAAHPGCTLNHMQRLRTFLSEELKHIPKQVQIFTPTPSTVSTTMYYCETDMAGKKLFCEKGLKGAQKQKDSLKRDEKGKGRKGPGRHR